MKPFPLYMITLTTAFVVLDVTGKIHWAWWQITLPLLIGVAVLLFAAIADGMPDAPGADRSKR